MLINEDSNLPHWAIEEMIALEVMLKLLDYKVKLNLHTNKNRNSIVSFSIEDRKIDMTFTAISIGKDVLQTSLKILHKENYNERYEEIKGLRESIDKIKELIV